jgi:hypothetical protein
MDVFCRANPVPHFLTKDLINIGHGNANCQINIGAYLVSPRMGPFFRGLMDALLPSLHQDKFKNNYGGIERFFDQKAYQDCLPSDHQNKHDDAVRPYFE